MKHKLFITPEYTTAEEIKRVRHSVGLTQKEFAMLINSSKSTVERWEASSEPITGNIVLLLKLLERTPEYVEEIRIPDKVYPLRLWYMHEQTVCTLIDVDEIMCDAEDVLIDYLDENGVTLTESVLAKHFVEMYIDVVRDLICDDFGVARVERSLDEETLDCDGDCEHCYLNNVE